MKICLILVVAGLLFAFNEAKKSNVLENLDKAARVYRFRDLKDSFQVGDSISTLPAAPKGSYVVVLKDSDGNVKAWYHHVWKGVKWGLRKVWDSNVKSILRDTDADLDDEEMPDDFFL